MSKPAPTCPYCSKPSHKITGRDIYPHHIDLHHKLFYRCEPCGAYVGCHDGTDTPLGRLANAELRRAKSAAHAVFDRLWKAKMQRESIKKHEARGKGYAWLATQLGIGNADCHIGMFDVDMCRRAIEICKPYLKGCSQ